MARELHPAENRGYRELYAFSRTMVDHWGWLAGRLGPGSPTAAALERGAAAAHDLISELEPVTAMGCTAGPPRSPPGGASPPLARGRATSSWSGARRCGSRWRTRST